MKIKINWDILVDKKMQKPNKKYLRNIEETNDYLNRTREKGEIDLLRIPAKLLLGILKNDIEKINSKHYKKSYLNELFNLVKNYLNIIKEDEEKYQLFARVLNDTCKLKYTDYDGFEYRGDGSIGPDDYPGQEHIDHNYIGDYDFIVSKPIPLKMIEIMLAEVKNKNKYNNKQENEELENIM